MIPPDNKGRKYKIRTPDPREILFKQFYIDPRSYTYMNILQSAIRAGYSKYYASNISHNRPRWWRELMKDAEVRRAKMLDKAEQHFDEVLDTPTSTEDRERLKLKQKTAEFISERVGKDVYSTRQELTGKDGKRLFKRESQEELTAELENLFIGVAPSPTDSRS